MGAEFPTFLKLEYERDGTAGQALLADIESTFGKAESMFREFSAEASRLIDVALGSGRTGGGKLNLDVAGLRDFASAQENAATAAREIAAATRAAAEAAGDYSAKARSAIAATEAEAKSRESAALAARSHAEAVEQVQNALQKSNTTVLTGEFLKLARAEEAAAEGARLLQSIGANTGSALMERSIAGSVTGLDRQTKSARESAAAFEALFAAHEKAAQAAAASAEELRGRLDPLFSAQQRFDQEMRTADSLLEAGAISTREYGQAQQLARDTLRQTNEALFAEEDALKRGTSARQSVINSSRSSRVAFIQLGQQMQDVTIQAQLGTNAFTIFAQQVPQAALCKPCRERSAHVC